MLNTVSTLCHCFDSLLSRHRLLSVTVSCLDSVVHLSLSLPLSLSLSLTHTPSLSPSLNSLIFQTQNVLGSTLLLIVLEYKSSLNIKTGQILSIKETRLMIFNKSLQNTNQTQTRIQESKSVSACIILFDLRPRSFKNCKIFKSST